MHLVRIKVDFGEPPVPVAARWLSSLGLVAALLLPRDAHATGTLCGTVRDASTNAVVAGAGIFVFTTSGTFTGFEGVSDLAGAFCIAGIPAGTYDLQVRRDHYRTTHVRNVVVTEDVTGVEIGVPPASGSLLPPSPNPARDRVEFRVRVDSPGTVRLEVFDVRGRRLKGWLAENATAGARVVTWDFRGAEGRVAPAGSYMVRLTLATASGVSTVSRTFTRVP
jgi:hypothetical protein